MKRDKPIGEKDCRVGSINLFLLSVVVLLSVQSVSVSIAGAANVSDSEMKYLDCASVVDWRICEGVGEVFAACNETPVQCANSVVASYYRQMWRVVDPQRCRVFNRLGAELIEPCPDLSILLPRASEGLTPNENGADKMGGYMFWMSRKLRGFGQSNQVHNWDRVGSGEGVYPESGIDQVSVTLAALNIGS